MTTTPTEPANGDDLETGEQVERPDDREPEAPPAETPEPGEDHSMDFVERYGPDES